MSLIVHARYVFWMVPGELAETVSTYSHHLPRSLGHLMCPRRRRATSYTFILFTLLRKLKWRRSEGKREAIWVPSPYPLSYPYFRFVHLCKKRRLSPHFMAIHLGYLCVCVSVPPRFELGNSVRSRIKSSKIANTYNDFFLLLSCTQRVAIRVLTHRQVQCHFGLLIYW